MANIKGTNISAPVVPFTEDDIYATHEAKYGRGGYRTVNTVDDLSKIPEARIEEGMLVYVLTDSSGIHTYQYLDGKWVRNRIGKGIPIYNQKLIDEYGITSQDQYISIPNESDLDGEVSNNTYTTTVNGNYVDVLFRSIRALQSEVAKLKNSFTYGIESYTGSITAMSSVVSSLSDSVSEEPLWAIQEDGLSVISGFEFKLGSGHSLEPASNVTVIEDTDTKDSYLKIIGTASWTATSVVRSATDSKLFLYLTTVGTNVKVNLDVLDPSDATRSLNSEKYAITVDYSKLKLPVTSESGLYNSLIVISRSQKLSDGNFYGKNFIWISISNPSTNTTLLEGYWKDNSIYETIQELGSDYRYSIIGTDFTDTTISKFSLYTKYQDFSKNVIPSKPTDQDYKLKTAHITIRSVDTQATLVAVKDQLLENELIWEEDTSKLWIKSGYKLNVIGGSTSGGDDNTGMTKEEMIAALKEMGIVQDTNGDLQLSNVNVEDITFIHQSTGKKYKFHIDDNGKLVSQILADDSDKFATRISSNSSIKLGDDVRGFIGQVRTAEGGISRTSDARLYSDRLKIGAFYAPFASDIVHGCSHSYVELENTSDVDIALDGCYLHYTRPDSTGNQVIYHLALTGIIPAGGTYLVRGAQHVPITDPNVYIKVESYDQEWYYQKSVGVNELISFEINDSIDISGFKAKGYGFALTYGNSINSAEISFSTALYRASVAGDIIGTGTTLTISDSNKSVYPYVLNQNFIDAIYYNKMVTDDSGKGFWAGMSVNIVSNSIYRNTFELDPAKQAFQALTTKDSSRVRWGSSNDIQVVSLDNEYITFPHTDDKYAVTNYTPKASFEYKNVSTDKTKMDPNKPNMVTSSFGIDIYKTRCFNWVSLGYYPEYIWVKKKSDTSWGSKFQSYIQEQEIKIVEISESTTASGTTTTVKFSVSTTGWLNGTSLSKFNVLTDAYHNVILNGFSCSYSSGYYLASITGSYSNMMTVGTTFFLHQSGDDLASSAYPRKKFFNADIINNIYAKTTGRFPGDNSFYTSHKIILDIVAAAVSTPTEYTYIVGRADKDGNPDTAHCSDEMSFTLYPSNYSTRIYQVTDQQGFHWIEYQVWSAVANKLNSKIVAETSSENIIPILVNTGDMTQNGTRVNEWFDYYEGGKSLFNHLEQMNVVGNNDLCGTDPSVLGTGDDIGKSNSYYFKLFYCYEVGSLFTPLCPNISAGGAPKYIPSLYYFDSSTDRFMMVNSEITEVNCMGWFGLISSDTGKTINIYTGYEINGKNSTYHGEFTSIYTMIWRTLSNASTNNKKVIAACHEMPFTVITNDSLLNMASGISRSLSNSNALVGSHLNQISSNEIGDSTGNPLGIYWFSRLLEYFGVRLVIGGHKHTYTCTYPVRENYIYVESGVTKTSIDNGPMPMEETLKDDSVNFISGSKDLTKFPLTKREDVGARADEGFYPCVCVPGLTGGVTYFMCQASGYKLTSNKELPSVQQKFSRILPKTTSTYSASTSTYTDKPSADQKYPMFSIINVASGSYSIKLARVTNVLEDSSHSFNQSTFGSGTVGLQYLAENSTDNFGTWSSTEGTLITID